jgi:hypothetical protein
VGLVRCALPTDQSLAVKLALNQMKLPPLIGVPLKFDAIAIWKVHFGPLAVAPEWSGPATLRAMRARQKRRPTGPSFRLHHSPLLLSLWKRESMEPGQESGNTVFRQGRGRSRWAMSVARSCLLTGYPPCKKLTLENLRHTL